MFKKKLEVTDVRITGVELSGDGENWADPKTMDNWASVGNGLAHIVDLISNGERVFLRTKYSDIYQNGTNGLPKTGPVYELRVFQMAPARQLIEAEAKPLLEEKYRHFYAADPEREGRCRACGEEMQHELHRKPEEAQHGEK